MKRLLKHAERDALWLIGIAFFLIVVLMALYVVSVASWKNMRVPLDASAYPVSGNFAWDGTGFGVLSRVRAAPGEPAEMFFARITPDGRSIVKPQKISGSADDVTSVMDIAWTGREYGAVWAEYERNNEERPSGCYLLFARIERNGKVHKSPWAAAGPLPSCPYDLSMVWTGREYGLAWDGSRTGENEDWRVYFTRLDMEGKKIGDDILVSPERGILPSVAWNGSSFGIVWIRHESLPDGVRFARFSADGVKQGEEVHLSEGEAWDPSITANGPVFGAVWSAFRQNVRQVYFASIDADGNPRGESRIISSNRAGSFAVHPVIAKSRTGFGAAWFNSDFTIRFKETDPDGNEFSPERRISDAPYMMTTDSPNIVPVNDFDYAVIWQEQGASQTANITYALSKYRSLSNIWDWVRGRVNVKGE